MKLSIVILNYNVRYFLELCLKSVQAAIANLDAEIIVVDNDSQDDSCQMVKALFPDVLLIENKENLGFSKGNNIGVAKSKGDYLCILNPDTVVPEDAFTKLFQFSENKENLGIVGCKLINGNGLFLPESKRKIPYVGAALKKILGNSNDYYANHLSKDDVDEVEILVGAFMFLKKDVYVKIDGFDEDYFMYGEDIDISYKAIKHGYKNYYYGKTTVIHYKGESTLKDRFYARRFYGAMQIFYKKHFKQNLLFDMFVWLGIKLAYIFRRIRKVETKHISEYIYVSNEKNEKLESVLPEKVILQNQLGKYKPNTEVIFDANVLSYKQIISRIEADKIGEGLTYKILPNKADFVIGSDNGFRQGEIIVLN